ncbi:MAG: hypothetical protein R6U32_00385 [Candidatus Woesearchaeota archaeon]
MDLDGISFTMNGFFWMKKMDGAIKIAGLISLGWLKKKIPHGCPQLNGTPLI